MNFLTLAGMFKRIKHLFAHTWMYRYNHEIITRVERQCTYCNTLQHWRSKFTGGPTAPVEYHWVTVEPLEEALDRLLKKDDDHGTRPDTGTLA